MMCWPQRAARHFISQTGRFPSRDPWNPGLAGAGGPGRWGPAVASSVRGRRGALGQRGRQSRVAAESQTPSRPGRKQTLPLSAAGRVCVWGGVQLPSAGPAGASRRPRAAAPAWAQRGPEEGGATHGSAGLTFLLPRTRPECRPGPAPASNGSRRFARHRLFRALDRAGSGRAGAQLVGVRVRAPGLGAPSSSA